MANYNDMLTLEIMVLKEADLSRPPYGSNLILTTFYSQN